jgi:2-dehydro-3-deoxyphosphogluconate aldolase/(4S)-4-hydroxy-2-oxoglutarate aldolase
MRDEWLSRFLRAGAVAVIRLDDGDELRPVVAALRDGGVRAVEITMTTPEPLRLIREAARVFGDEILLGVGSVLTPEAASEAVAAGARFVVSPIFKPEIVAAAHAAGVPAMPGAFTPTEIQTAHEAGADVVKVFPAGVVGKGFFRAVRAPMPHLRLMPTGGVTLDNAGEWLRAGACAVGVGSALLDRQAIAEGRFEVLTENARRLMTSIDAAR